MLNALILASGWLALSVSASPFDGAQPLICASTEILECIPGAGCDRVTAESIDAPQFIRIDFSANALSAERLGGGTKVSTIERSETVEGKLILQGAEEGREAGRVEHREKEVPHVTSSRSRCRGRPAAGAGS